MVIDFGAGPGQLIGAILQSRRQRAQEQLQGAQANWDILNKIYGQGRIPPDVQRALLQNMQSASQALHIPLPLPRVGQGQMPLPQGGPGGTAPILPPGITAQPSANPITRMFTGAAQPRTGATPPPAPPSAPPAGGFVPSPPPAPAAAPPAAQADQGRPG